jgi:hypothetical protein
MMQRKMPIGIQDFEKLRTQGCAYVDKNAYVYRLAREAAPYFSGNGNFLGGPPAKLARLPPASSFAALLAP